MEKVLVPVAFSGVRIGAPAPEPVLVVSVALEDGAQTLSLWRSYLGEFTEKTKFTWKPGELQHSRADLMACAMGDSLYNFLVQSFGLVRSFEQSVP